MSIILTLYSMEFRLFYQLSENLYNTLLVMELSYDNELDWYQIRVFRGHEIIGYLHGYANEGWAPEVNNIWVAERFRRRGIASAMMTKVESFFGQIPLPATPIQDNDAARSFWQKYIDRSP